MRGAFLRLQRHLRIFWIFGDKVKPDDSIGQPIQYWDPDGTLKDSTIYAPDHDILQDRVENAYEESSKNYGNYYWNHCEDCVGHDK